MNFALASEDAVSRKLSGSDTHSRCQGGDKTEQRRRFRDAVARHVLGDGRVVEAELFAKEMLHLQAAIANRGERAGSTRELAEQDTRPPLVDALDVAVDRRQPDRGPVAEGHRQGLLEVRAAGHRRVAMLTRETREDCTQILQVARDDIQRYADLEHVGGVHDVLRGRAPVDVTACVAGGLGELMDQQAGSDSRRSRSRDGACRIRA